MPATILQEEKLRVRSQCIEIHMVISVYEYFVFTFQ